MMAGMCVRASNRLFCFATIDEKCDCQHCRDRSTEHLGSSRIEIIFAMENLNRPTWAELLRGYSYTPACHLGSFPCIRMTNPWGGFFCVCVPCNRSPLSKWSAVLCATYFGYRGLLRTNVHIITKSIFPRIQKWVWMPGPGNSSAIPEGEICISNQKEAKHTP